MTAPDPAPFVPQLPALSSIPRDSAVDTQAMMRAVLTLVRRYAAGPLPDEEVAADFRRRLAVVVDTVRRRDLSKVAVLDGDHAARLAAWVFARTITTWGSWAKAESWRWLAQLRGVELADLEIAIEQARIAWDVSDEAVGAVLAGRAIVKPAEPEPVAALPVTMADLLNGASVRLQEIASDLRASGAASPSGLDPAFAADLARTLWDTCTPVVSLHNQLKIRGKQ